MTNQRSLRDRAGDLLRKPDMRKAHLVRLVLRSLRRLAPGVSMVVLDGPDGPTALHASADIITPIYLAFGHFQHDELAKATSWAASVGRATDGVLLDVGANVGTTSLDALRNGSYSRAVCIEPAPDNVRVLELNVHLNGLGDRCTVLPVACGAERSTVQVLSSGFDSGDHRVGDVGAAVPEGHTASVEVEALPLDDAVARAGVAPGDISLVWIDTQGFESHVLAGSAGTFAGGAPACMEVWPDEHRRRGTLDALLEQIELRFERFCDLRAPALALRDIGEVRGVVDALGPGQTDLFLVPRRADGAGTGN